MLFSSPRQMVKDEDWQDFGTNILEKHMNISTHAVLIGIFVSYYSQNTLQSQGAKPDEVEVLKTNTERSV